jgi:hypothetical protein
MKDFHTPDQLKHLIEANKDAAMEGGPIYEQTGEDLEQTRQNGQRVVTAAWGVAIVEAEEQTTAE